jgi:hypothetical protein
MTLLNLSFACETYDRIRALQDGRVRPEGIDLNIIPLTVEETFYRQARYREFDASEMSLSSYLLTLDLDEPPFVALPVFPSRMFRHQSIYINKNSGISSPADLIGKRVGVPEYQLTAPVWQRGILAEHYGVPVESVRYFTGGIEQPGRIEKLKLNLPPEVSVRRCRRCSPRVNSTRCTRRTTRWASGRCHSLGGCSRTSLPLRRTTTGRPGSSPSCTRSSCAGRCTSSTRGSRGR